MASPTVRRGCPCSASYTRTALLHDKRREPVAFQDRALNEWLNRLTNWCQDLYVASGQCRQRHVATSLQFFDSRAFLVYTVELSKRPHNITPGAGNGHRSGETVWRCGKESIPARIVARMSSHAVRFPVCGPDSPGCPARSRPAYATMPAAAAQGNSGAGAGHAARRCLPARRGRRCDCSGTMRTRRSAGWSGTGTTQATSRSRTTPCGIRRTLPTARRVSCCARGVQPGAAQLGCRSAVLHTTHHQPGELLVTVL